MSWTIRKKGNEDVVEGQVTIHFQNGALTVNPSKLSSLVKNEMSVVTWVKIESLNQLIIIYSCVGGGVAQWPEHSRPQSLRFVWSAVETRGSGNIAFRMS